MRQRKYFVSPSCFDDIGAVLDQMGKGFEHQEIDWDDLMSTDVPTECDVLFLNCSGHFLEDSDSIAASVKRFVLRGGSLYASDWAGGILETAFPERIAFARDGAAGEQRCRVLDSGLQEIIGDEITIHFDLPGWYGASGKGLRVFIEDRKHHPIIVGFGVGKGHVIFTSFHNEAQLSEHERKLLQYLVLRPVMAQAAAAAAQVAQTQACSPNKEIVATIDPGRCSPNYVCQITSDQRVLFILSWNGTAQLGLTVIDPAGRTVFQGTAGRSPLIHEVPAAVEGTWSCGVKGKSVPHANFPYVITIATRGKPAGKPAAPPAARPTPAPAPTPPMVSSKLWSCYILVDCSQRASDVAPVIGRGLSNIIRSLKNASLSLVPAISVTPLRESFSGISAPCRIDQMQAMNLSCQGGLKLRQPVQEMVRTIERHAAAGEPKPLVVVMLASHPADDASPVMSQLSNLCARGKANVVAVAMGAGSSDAPLVRPGGICLRVDDPYGKAGEECFTWIGKTIESILAALGGSAAGRPLSLPPLPHGVRLLR